MTATTTTRTQISAQIINARTEMNRVYTTLKLAMYDAEAAGLTATANELRQSIKAIELAMDVAGSADILACTEGK